jgi:predicted HD phosphohydrolase/predicted nucleotidyltransferase
MADRKTRMAIASRAASLMYEGLEKEYFTAKRKAAKQMGIDYRYRPGDLPSNCEIRDQVQSLARLMEGDDRFEVLRSMRLSALSLMRKLKRFRPRLIGSVWTGHIRKDSDIDIHLFSDNASSITDILDEEGLTHATERKRVIKHGEARTFTHIHVYDDHEYELTLYPSDKAHYVFKSSITGKAIERGSIRELEELLRNEKPDCDLESELYDAEEMMNPYEMYDLLLRPLENVKQSKKHHPEGDALYHSLQVFELARQERPYDEEFIVAALLHDIGKAIDPHDHVFAALEALEGLITERTFFLIEHHMDALKYKDGTLGHRARRRLAESEYFEDLMLLRELDSAGRQPGMQVSELEDALDFIRKLEEEFAVR